MIFRLILILAIALTQETVGSWKSFSSFHTLKTCEIISENKLACLTDGGILQFDFLDNSTENVSTNQGITKADYNNFGIDPYQNLWIPSFNNEVIIDIWSSNQNKKIQQYNFDISKILLMDSDSTNFLVSYLDNDEIGLMHFNYTEEEWRYSDYFLNFGISINDIYDLKIFENSIWISTNEGILKGDFNTNLKIGDNWSLILVNNEENHFIDGNKIQWYNQDSVFLYSDIISSFVLQNDIGNSLDKIIFDDSYYGISDNKFFIFDSNEVQFSFKNPFSSNFVDINFLSDKIYITVEKHGILEFNITDLNNPILFSIPATSLNKKFSAITVLENDDIVGVGVDGIGLFDGLNWQNYYPNSSEFNFNPENFDNFELDYKLSSGGDGSIFPTWSIVEDKPNSILFANTQIKPNNPGYAGALIEYDFVNEELTVFDTTNNILDGLDGIFNSGWSDRNLIVNQIKVDPDGNAWVLNPYAEADSNIIAIRPKNSENWVHIKAPQNEEYFIPTELDFDKFGRVWVAFEERTSMENEVYSKGGLKILLLVGDLESNFNYYWRDIENLDVLPNMNVWSITIDKQGFIWVLTSGGIQGYSTMENSQYLNPIYLINFYNYLPLYRGDHIRVDSQDNKWISTRHSGVKVILENTQYWPTTEGFTAENSGLLSNIVNDFAFDEKNGFIWFATDLGISRFEYPITVKNIEKNSLLFHPNPFKPIINNEVIIEGCFPNSSILINDISGKHITTLTSLFIGEASSQVLWDGLDKNGNLVETGVYLISSRSEKGELKRGKLAVIKQ